MHLVTRTSSEWCPGPELNRYVSFETRDFKSRASASFATRAFTRNHCIVQNLLQELGVRYFRWSNTGVSSGVT